jgi:xylulokinase
MPERMDAMDELLLGLDIGTASSQAVLAQLDGSIVASAQQFHRSSLPAPGHVEHDAERVWWHDVKALCERLLSGSARQRLAGVCVSGVGPCLLPCDADLRPLRPAILYGIDTRAQQEIEELNDRYGERQILMRAGSALSSQALGPKLLWLQRHEPGVWRQTSGWYMASSFVVARLTGEYVLDHPSASQCDPLYDLQAGDWAEHWSQELAGGVDLPRLVWPTEIVGTVTDRGSQDSGIPVGVPVAAGTIDAWSEAFSVGVRRPGEMMAMYGSTMFLIGVCSQLVTHPKLWATAGVEPGKHCIAAGMSTSGALIEWLRELAGKVPIETLVHEAAQTPPGAQGVLMLPYFAGERSPLFDPHARGVIVGLSLSHRLRHLARAAYEATGFGVRHNLEAIAQAAGKPDRVLAVGGGAGGGFWPQIVSDIAGVEQILPVQNMGASYGDALMAGIGTGLLDPCADWTKVRRIVSPKEEHRQLYDELYGLYRRLYPDTAPITHKLATLKGAADVG